MNIAVSGWDGLLAGYGNHNESGPLVFVGGNNYCQLYRTASAVICWCVAGAQ